MNKGSKYPTPFFQKRKSNFIKNFIKRLLHIPHHFLWLCPNKLEVKEATSSINLHLFLPLTGVYVLYKIYGFLLLQNISFFLPKRGENRKMFSVFNFSPSRIFFLFFPRRREIKCFQEYLFSSLVHYTLLKWKSVLQL